MRLRKLATSQSIVFVAPPEVHQSIQDLGKKKLGNEIDSAAVIRWLLEQTCSAIEQMQPLYFSHGVDFCRRTQAALDLPNFLVNADHREAHLRTLRQTEHQKLEDLYAPRSTSSTVTKPEIFAPQLDAFMKQLNDRQDTFQESGEAIHVSALEEVEQEREVAFEVEAVREVQKPVQFSALSFRGLHKDIIGFLKTGRLAVNGQGYEHAFVALRRTALGQKYGLRPEAFTSRFLVSEEFTRTVDMWQDIPNDNFLVSCGVYTVFQSFPTDEFLIEPANKSSQRQVSWILWSAKSETALVIIAEEAELVIPLLRTAQNSPTHLMTYAAPVTRKMLPFHDLCYYVISALPIGWKPPTWLRIELGIFAGRLYFEFKEYAEILKYLALESQDGRAKLREETFEDGYVAEMAITNSQEGKCRPVVATDDQIYEASGRKVDVSKAQAARLPICNKPLSFLQEWLAIRRKGQDFTHTPMGYVCQGKVLKVDHPFFRRVQGNRDTTGDGANARDSKANGLASALRESEVFGEEEEDDGDEYYYECGKGEGADQSEDGMLTEEDGGWTGDDYDSWG